MKNFSAPERDDIVRVKGVGVKRDGRWLVRGVDMAIARGEIVTLIGPNGSGKSTTVKTALGIIKPDEGSVWRAKNLAIGYVPQKIAMDRSLPMTVERLMGLTGRRTKAEVAATLAAAKAGYPERRVVLVFQPHRYSRTRDLMDDFATVLSEADALVLLDVYAAGEEPIAGADGRTMARAVRTRGAVDPVFVENLEDLADVLGDVLREGDLVLTMGAGDIGAYAHSLPERLGKGLSLKVHS